MNSTHICKPLVESSNCQEAARPESHAVANSILRAIVSASALMPN